MNPGIPVLLALSMGPLVVGRRERGWAWCVIGLAGMLLLAPALLLPSGIPSPAAAAGSMAPWTGTLDAEAGNPTLVDVTFQIQPWLVHLRRELRCGRLPYWNPYQFSGAPFWANGQSAPLFPLHLLVALLPLQLGLTLLPWLRVTIGGYGAWCLARTLGVAPFPALAAGLAFPLSGMVSSFLLFPMANALCLVPWVLRESELLARREGSWRRLAGVVGVQALAGHPETVAHTVMVAMLWMALRQRGGSLRLWSRFVAGVVTGGLAAAAHLLPVALNVLQSSRWKEWHPGGPLPWPVLMDLPLRLVLPDLWGHPAAGTWIGPFNYNATAVFAGIVALLLASAGAWDRRRHRAWQALVGVLVLSALAAWQVPPLRQLLVAVPGIGRMLHHRLLFAVELGLALLAAAGLETLLRGRGPQAMRALAAGCGSVAFLLGVAWWRHLASWEAFGLVSHQSRWTLWSLAVGVFLLLFSSLEGRPRLRSGLTGVALAALLGELLWAHGITNPGLPLGKLLPETPAIAFLQEKPGRMAATGAALRPNAAMVHRLRDIRGDDTLKLSRYEAVYAELAEASPTYFVPVERWESPWLDRLGVAWVLSPPGQEAPVKAWDLVYDGPDARVFARPGARPLARWETGGDSGVVVTRSQPGLWDLSWSSPTGGKLVVAETWDPGWRAEVAKRTQSVEAVSGVFLGISVPPGEGRLRLRYRPPGLATGAVISLAALVVLLTGVRRRPAAKGRER